MTVYITDLHTGVVIIVCTGFCAAPFALNRAMTQPRRGQPLIYTRAIPARRLWLWCLNLFKVFRWWSECCRVSQHMLPTDSLLLLNMGRPMASRQRCSLCCCDYLEPVPVLCIYPEPAFPMVSDWRDHRTYLTNALTTGHVVVCTASWSWYMRRFSQPVVVVFCWWFDGRQGTAVQEIKAVVTEFCGKCAGMCEKAFWMWL